MQDREALQYKKMTETPVSKLVITLGIPTTISMLVTNFYNMVDTYFVGGLGKSASAAVGIVFGLMAIIQAFGFMFGQGAGSNISRKLGERDVNIVSKFASTGFFCSFAAGLVITVLGFALFNPFLRLLGSTDTILPYARQYGFFILLAAPMMTSSFSMNTILRYEGKASLAMIGLMAGAILNIFGDWLLMTRFNMGVAGAGLSTAVSQVVSFFILLSMFLRGKTQSRIAFRMIARDWGTVRNIASNGFPSMIRQGLASISTMMLNNQAGLYGDAAVSAMTIVNRICFFAFAAGLGIGQGFQPVSAYNYGAGKYSRVRKAFWFTVSTGEVILGLLAVIGLFMPSKLVGLFIKDPEVIAIGGIALTAQLIALFFQPLPVGANMMFQSIGKNREATWLAMLRSGLFFIPIIFLLPHFIGLTGVMFAQAISDGLTFMTTIPFVIRFLRTLPADIQRDAETVSLAEGWEAES